MDVANQVIAKMAEVNEVEVPDRFLLKQKPHLEAKNEVGMGSLIASSKLRGKQILRNIRKKYVKLELVEVSRRMLGVQLYQYQFRVSVLSYI